MLHCCFYFTFPVFNKNRCPRLFFKLPFPGSFLEKSIFYCISLSPGAHSLSFPLISLIWLLLFSNENLKVTFLYNYDTRPSHSFALPFFSSISSLLAPIFARMITLVVSFLFIVQKKKVYRDWLFFYCDAIIAATRFLSPAIVTYRLDSKL